MWFLPTYGRPQNLRKMATSVGGLPPFTQVLLTESDPKRTEYVWDYWNKRIVPAKSLGDVLRWILPNYPNEKFYGVITDDFALLRPLWWGVLEEAAGDVYIATAFTDGDEGRLPGIPCFGGDLVRAMGSLMPVENIHHNSTDVVWYTIGVDFGLLKLFSDGMVRHDHVNYGRAEMDDTYKRGAYNPEFKASDPIAFDRWITSADRQRMNDRITALLSR